MPGRSRRSRSRRSEIRLELGARPRSSRSGWPEAIDRLSWSARHSIVAVIGLLIAIMAFAHSAAQIGLAVPAFRTLGPNFYAWSADQQRLDLAIQTPNLPKPSAAELSTHGQWLLASQPMASQGYRSLAYARAADGDAAKARAAMLTAQAMTRRDALTQIWLIDNAVSRQDVVGMMQHFDYLLRTQADARGGLLNRVAVLLNVPDARRAMMPLMTRSNPWFDDLIIQASDNPQTAIGAAQFLAERGWAPGGERLKPTYGALLSNLVRAGRFDLLRRIYRLLPAGNPATLSSLAMNRTQFSEGYVPLTWSLAASGDFGGLQTDVPGVGAAVEGYAQPLTRGVVAEKLVFLDSDAHQMRWRVVGRQANPGAEALWQVDCLDGANSRTVATSRNLFELPKDQAASLTIGANCPIAMVRLIVAGGAGRSASSITVGDTALTRAGN